MTYLAMIIPFTFGVEPFQGGHPPSLRLCVVHAGGAISVILINVPGTGANATTLLDAFPMASWEKRGGERKRHRCIGLGGLGGHGIQK